LKPFHLILELLEKEIRMIEQDYIMRLIHEMVRTVLKLLFHIDMDKKEELLLNEKETEEKYNELLNLIDKGEINEAENKLLDELNPADIQNYKLALMFYLYLNEKDIDFLEEHNFSRGEITDGLKYVSEIYGYGSMADALLSILLD
jgi:hypothetical protein